MYSEFEYYSNNILFVFVFGHNSESEYYSYSYSAKYYCTNIIHICIRSFWKTNIIRIPIRSKIWFRILFVFVFGPKNSIRSPLAFTPFPVLRSPFCEFFWCGFDLRLWLLIICVLKEILHKKKVIFIQLVESPILPFCLLFFAALSQNSQIAV